MNNWINQIDNNTTQFVTHFGALNAQELNWKPNSNTWSIAQNLDHLMVINSTYFPILTALKKGTYKTPFAGRIGFLTAFMGRMILNASNADRKKKIKTFSIWEPSQSKFLDNIVERFVKHQEELKQEIEAAKSLVETGVVIASPANKSIIYKLATAFDIIVVHEQRHLEQAKEVLIHLKKSRV